MKRTERNSKRRVEYYDSLNETRDEEEKMSCKCICVEYGKDRTFWEVLDGNIEYCEGKGKVITVRSMNAK